MRGLNLVIAALLISISASAQTMEKEGKTKEALFGFDPSAAILKGSARIKFGLAFSQHWSVDGSISIGISRLKNERSIYEKKHYEELETDYRNVRSQDLFQGTTSLSYWPQRCFKGTFFTFGGRYGDTEGADIRIGTGYMFRVWRIIHADIRYEADLISSCKSNLTVGDNISIGIYLIF